VLHIRSSHGHCFDFQLNCILSCLKHSSLDEPSMYLVAYEKWDVFNFYLLMSQFPLGTTYGRQYIVLKVQWWTIMNFNSEVHFSQFNTSSFWCKLLCNFILILDVLCSLWYIFYVRPCLALCQVQVLRGKNYSSSCAWDSSNVLRLLLLTIVLR